MVLRILNYLSKLFRWNREVPLSPKFLWGALTFLFTILSLYLFYRDAQFIFEERSQSLYQTSQVISQLLPQNQLEEARTAKDQNLPVLAGLSESLLSLRERLRIKGDFSLIQQEGDRFRFIVSTDPDRRLGDQFAVDTKLAAEIAGGRFSHHFEWSGSASSALSLYPFAEGSFVLVLQTHESAVFFRLANLALHYLLLVGGLGLLLVSWIVMQHHHLKRRLQRAEDLISQIFEHSHSRFAILDSTLHLSLANPSLLQYLNASFEEVEGLSPFQPNEVFSILPIDQAPEELDRKLRSLRSLRVKVRILGKEHIDRYAELQFLYQAESREHLVLVDDLKAASFSEVTEASLESGDFIDAETGIPHFSFLKSQMETRWEEIRKTESCLLYIDLDDFKFLEREHGTLVASNLIREFAQYLRKFFRSSDLVVRLKQDEFLVLLPQTTLSAASTIAENLLAKAKASNQDRALFSVGVAPLNTLDHFDDWVARAYAAVKNAKLAGKGRVEVQTADAIQIEA